MQIGHDEHLAESIWNDYSIPEVASLEEDNLENVINQELMVAATADVVDEHLPGSEEGCTAASIEENEKVTIFQPVGLGSPLEVDNDAFAVICRCCNKNFTFLDLKIHIAEKSTDGYFSCDWCTEIFLLKDLNDHMLSHLGANRSSPQHLSLLPHASWYDHNRLNSFKGGEKIAITETGEKISFVKSPEKTNVATSRDTANTSSFVSSFVNLQSAQPLQNNELPTIKRVKTDTSITDNSNLEGEKTQQLIKPVTVRVNKDEDSENRRTQIKGINEVNKEVSKSIHIFERFSRQTMNFRGFRKHRRVDARSNGYVKIQCLVWKNREN